MKKTNTICNCFFTLLLLMMAGCYKLQTDYKYVPHELDPHVNMTAKDYLLSRSDSVTPGKVDTVFRWMKMGLVYAGIDFSEFEKPGRTFIFLHNNAIKTVTSGKVTAGFFFDYPVLVKDALGKPIPSKIDPTVDSTKPANSWSDYSQTTVKNYFLSLILQGEYGFDNLTITNTAVTSLLPAGTKAGNDSKLGFVVTHTTPDPSPSAQIGIAVDWTNGGNGFDPEGKMNLMLVNNQNSPIRINDRTDDRTAGYLATNGQIHVFDKTIHPFRYSY